MLNCIKRLIPEGIRIFIHQCRIKARYDVIMEKGSTAYNCVFEGRNRLNANARITNCRIGFGTYISGNSRLRKVTIGRYCCIGQHVETGFGNHPTDWVSTHPAFYSLQSQAGFTFADKQLLSEHKYADSEQKYYVCIGNDVWIGNDVKIMDGVTVGDGAILAMGSVVVKDVEPYSIVGGVPAKLIKKRFSDSDIKLLHDMKWWDKDLAWIESNWMAFSSIKALIDAASK